MKRLLILLILLIWALPTWAADFAQIQTKHGLIAIQLHRDKAPKTVANFIKLANKGFYDGLTFHRVIPGFVAQGGDPDGNGRGGPGYTVEAEIDPTLKHQLGAVATARQGDRVNPERRSSGSQFYICLGAPSHLDGAYTIFGQVIEGMDAVRKIRRGDTMQSVKIVTR